MKVVFDTNVVISAALKDRLPEAVILFVAEHADFQWVASPDIIAEYDEVLRRPKFKLPETIIQRWLDAFQQFVTVIEVERAVDFSRDPKDAKFFGVRIVGECQLSRHGGQGLRRGPEARQYHDSLGLALQDLGL